MPDQGNTEVVTPVPPSSLAENSIPQPTRPDPGVPEAKGGPPPPPEVAIPSTPLTSAAVQTQSPAPTSADQWSSSRKQGFVVTLPSGNVAKVRRSLSLDTLLKIGKIPNPLASVVQKMITMGKPDLPIDELDQQVLVQLLDLVDENCVSMMLEPQVSAPGSKASGESDTDYAARVDVWEPEEGTVSVFDISTEDKMFLFYVGQGEAADLEKFRDEQASVLERVSPSEVLQPEAESTGGGG